MNIASELLEEIRKAKAMSRAASERMELVNQKSLARIACIDESGSILIGNTRLGQSDGLSLGKWLVAMLEEKGGPQ